MGAMAKVRSGSGIGITWQKGNQRGCYSTSPIGEWEPVRLNLVSVESWAVMGEGGHAGPVSHVFCGNFALKYIEINEISIMLKELRHNGLVH
ncbi:hypothetical protein GCM10008094_27710 [Aidingimonas halophila]|nr:hypothetical protein GCM10008094_27710 [Aidingimonas halophila]